MALRLHSISKSKAKAKTIFSEKYFQTEKKALRRTRHFDRMELELFRQLIVEWKKANTSESDFRLSDEILEKIKNNIMVIDQPDRVIKNRKRAIDSVKELENEQRRITLQNQLNTEVKSRTEKQTGTYEI